MLSVVNDLYIVVLSSFSVNDISLLSVVASIWLVVVGLDLGVLAVDVMVVLVCSLEPLTVVVVMSSVLLTAVVVGLVVGELVTVVVAPSLVVVDISCATATVVVVEATLVVGSMFVVPLPEMAPSSSLYTQGGKK